MTAAKTIQNKEATKAFAVQDVPGRGKGIISTMPIPRGTRILCEEPLVINRPGQSAPKQLLDPIHRQVDALSKEQREAFLSLHNIHPYMDAKEQYVGIFRTNALPIHDEEIDGGIFLEASRLNHACDNNAQKSWNENIKRHTIHAIRDIPAGDEITITYLGTLRNREERQKALRDKFGFTCKCRLCSLPLELSREADKRLDQIFYIDRLVGYLGIDGLMSQPLKMLRFIDRQVCLYNEHGPHDIGLPRAYIDAAQLVIAHNDLARGKAFIERALSGWRCTEGDDSPQMDQFGNLYKNPSECETYGISKRWTTKVDEIPQGLSEPDFDDWLWRREKPLIPGQPANFRNSDFFLNFADLPNEYEVDPRFYDGFDRQDCSPRSHWCIIGEIVSSLNVLRLQMEVKDKNGAIFPLFFYTKSRGDEVPYSQRKIGNTVVLMYAKNHTFLDGQVGIRHEEDTYFKVRFYFREIHAGR
jgi:hypothetical protein